MDTTARTRQLIYIAVGIIGLALVGYLAYRLFSGGEQPAPQTQGPPGGAVGAVGALPVPLNAGTGTGDGQIPPPASPTPAPSVHPAQTGAQPDLVQLTDFSVIGPVLSKDETTIKFYKKNGGHMFSSDFSGDKQEISNLTLVGVMEAQWSSAKDRSLVSYLEGDAVKAFLHIGSSTVINIGSDVRGATWAPNGRELAYTSIQNNLLRLTTGDSTGKNMKTIYQTPVLDAQVNWIQPNVFVFQTAPSGLAGGYIFFYTRTSGSFRRAVGPLPGMASVWSPDGSRGLISYTDLHGKNPRYLIMDATGRKSESNEGLLLVEKCSWAGNRVLYCAIPKAIPETAVIPDSYLRGELSTQDRLLRIDLDKNESHYILNDSTFDMTNLLITKNEDYLIFVNKPDGTLWRLKLK